MSGIRRQRGTRPLRKAAPLRLDPLGRLLEPIKTSTIHKSNSDQERVGAQVAVPYASAGNRCAVRAVWGSDHKSAWDNAKRLVAVVGRR